MHRYHMGDIFSTACNTVFTLSIRTNDPEQTMNPVSIHYKFIAGHYRPVRVADGPITARYRFIKNASWVHT